MPVTLSTFKSSAACVADDTGLSISAVLSTLPRPTMALVIPDTVPVKVGDSIFAFKLIEVKYGLSIAAVSAIFSLVSIPFTLPAYNAYGVLQNCEVPRSTYSLLTFQLALGTEGSTAIFKFKKKGPFAQSIFAILLTPLAYVPLPSTMVNIPAEDAVTLNVSEYTIVPVAVFATMASLT